MKLVRKLLNFKFKLMKNILFILLSLPFLIFGQTDGDCGDAPFNPFAATNPLSIDKQSVKYKKYTKVLQKYNSCILKDMYKPLNLDINTKLIKFEGVIIADGMSKKDIYFSIKEWFASSKNLALNQSDQNYNEKSKLYEVDDIENGRIITQMHNEIRLDNTGNVDETQKGGKKFRYWIKYTFKVIIKDGRFKYIITSIIKDKYLFHDLKSIKSKKKKFLTQKKPVTNIEELVIDNLYKKNGDLNIPNAYLKLKLITINSDLAKSLQSHIKSVNDEDDW